jgi:hypothetical protein
MPFGAPPTQLGSVVVVVPGGSVVVLTDVDVLVVVVVGSAQPLGARDRRRRPHASGHVVGMRQRQVALRKDARRTYPRR